MPNNNQRIKQTLVIIATVGVFAINYLAAKGFINNRTPEAISDSYPTAITPAGYAFSIWALIYLGLAVFSIYQALPKNAEKFIRVRSLYIQSCVANCLWLYLWHYDQILASIAVMFILLGLLVLINLDLMKNDSTADYWIARVPFNLYLGWITAATILNFTIALVYLGVTASDLTTPVLACILLIAATVLGVVLRPGFSNSAYPLAIAWALTAIAVKHGGQTLIVSIASLCVGILLVSSLTFLLQDKKSIR